MDPSPSPAPSLVTRGELYGLMLAAWLGSTFVLTALPALLIPRFGIPGGMCASYALVFLALQPLQQVMQRAFGPGAALMRGLGVFVAAAAVAVYLRGLLAGVPPA
jgi:hypothetical protein